MRLINIHSGRMADNAELMWKLLGYHVILVPDFTAHEATDIASLVLRIETWKTEHDKLVVLLLD